MPVNAWTKNLNCVYFTWYYHTIPISTLHGFSRSEGFGWVSLTIKHLTSRTTGKYKICCEEVSFCVSAILKLPNPANKIGVSKSNYEPGSQNKTLSSTVLGSLGSNSSNTDTVSLTDPAKINETSSQTTLTKNNKTSDTVSLTGKNNTTIPVKKNNKNDTFFKPSPAQKNSTSNILFPTAPENYTIGTLHLTDSRARNDTTFGSLNDLALSPFYLLAFLILFVCVMTCSLICSLRKSVIRASPLFP